MVPAAAATVVAVFEAEALVVVPVVVLELLELPQAAIPIASSAQPASAPNLFLITASPWLSCHFGRLMPGVGVEEPRASSVNPDAHAAVSAPASSGAGWANGVHSPITVSSVAAAVDVNIS
jgi:hypothetical protein